MNISKSQQIEEFIPIITHLQAVGLYEPLKKSLLDSGITWLEDYTKIPVLGVLPYSDIFLSAEDSLSLLDRPAQKPKAELNISVIRLPHIANFTDFDPL